MTQNRQAARQEVSAHDSRLPGQRSHWFVLPESFGKEPLTQQSRRKLRGGLIAASIPGRVFALAWPTETGRRWSKSYTAQTSFGNRRSSVQSNATRIFLSSPGNLLR